MGSKIQRIIVPRNWLFGRLCYIRANLMNIIKVNPENFTTDEHSKLKEAARILEEVISDKKKNSETLKTIFRKP